MILFLLVLGSVLLYFGAEWLVKGGVRLAVSCGITPLVVGLTVVAFGTSAPELVVSVQAAFGGYSEIAVGNVVGSNIFNICFILGLAALINPMKVTSQLIKFDTPIMIGVSILFALLFLDKSLGRIEGAILFAGVVAYTSWSVVSARKEVAAGKVPAGIEEEVKDEVGDASKAPLWQDILLIVVGLLLLVGGAKAFVEGSVMLARKFGLSEAVIGLTIVAAGTSLPELATSIVAAIRKQQDIAIGNIVGSNIFNILCILGVASIIKPIHCTQISYVDLGVMIFSSVLLLPFMRTGFILSRWEGAVFLAIYGGYLAWLWPK